MTDGGRQENPIVVDVIIPVHNAEKTIEEAVRSSMEQSIPEHLLDDGINISVNVCCFDDGSKDNSLGILRSLQEMYSKEAMHVPTTNRIESTLLVGSTSPRDMGRGAGYARNKAAELSPEIEDLSCAKCVRFLCLLDSDDVMHRHRIAEQAHYMMNCVNEDDRCRTILGSKFKRDPLDSTWHYSNWANTLPEDRLMLERFREVTILHPTWFMSRSRWKMLGGYIEAPQSGSVRDLLESEAHCNRHRLIHETHDTLSSLRLAEDLRFFHEHLAMSGLLRRVDTETPLVTYRHDGQSQSYRTSRKLLQQLRILAFEKSILDSDPIWQKNEGRFVIWGAGRDGKEFVKTLRADLRRRVYCFVDLDSKKLESGSYVNRELDLKIPIVHYSYLATDSFVRTRIQKEWEVGSTDSSAIGCIDKSKTGSKSRDSQKLETHSRTKRRRLLQIPKLESSGLSESILQELPVVVCVAMYRTNGALEANVKSIGRTEGKDLWHFS